jgi:ABC-2 type transport system permease protein
MPLVLAVAHFGFGVPIRGELWELGLASLAFIMCNESLGVLVSTYAQNQQQSMLGTFIILYPAQMLSGILYPLENMPKWLYWMTYLNPLRYFAVLIRNIMLKGGSPELFWPNIGGLVVLTAFLLTLAWRRFSPTLN